MCLSDASYLPGATEGNRPVTEFQPDPKPSLSKAQTMQAFVLEPGSRYANVPKALYCKSPIMAEMLFFFANSLLFSQRTNDAGEGSNVLDTGSIKQKCHCKAGGDNSGGKENTEWSVPGLGGAFIF